jgi:mannose-6-phosphate isomerase
MKLAQAAQEDDKDFFIDEALPYAELWLGTHPNGMSTVTVHKELQHGSVFLGCNKESLLEYVRSDLHLHCGRDEWSDLTFLLKVLSVNKVLSIQAHPDKKLAERLFKERPDVYKDPNHKPEMAIALSEKVKAMCGFRPLQEIYRHIQAYPELRALVGEETTEEVADYVHSPATRAVLRDMFQAYIESSDEKVQEQVEILVERLKALADPSSLDTLMLQLAEQFPGDCGILAPLIFNVVEIDQGEGLYIGENEPHAYLSGDILECMACSDNVVRAGLTPKLKDVHTLVNMLTYKSEMPNIQRGHVVDDCTIRYEPPVADFCVEIIHVPAGTTYEILDVASPSVFLTLQGEACLRQGNVCSLDVSFGSAAFASANTRCVVIAGPEGVQLTRAFTNIFHDSFMYEGLEF